MVFLVPPNLHFLIVVINLPFNYSARNDDLVERMNGKMKKTEDTVETVNSKMKVLETEQEKMTSTIGGMFKKIFESPFRDL